MKRTLAICLALLIPSAANADDLAIVGGDVYTVSGAMIPAGTILIKNDRITQVGKDLAVPQGYRVIDAKGKPVTPGLIESNSSIGLVEVGLEASTVDFAPNLKDAIRAAVRASDAIDLRSTLVGVARRHGVTNAISAPRGGIVSGRSAFLDLVSPASRRFDDAVVDAGAMHGAIGEYGAGAFGGSRASAMMRLREALDDARNYRRSKTAFLRRGLYELSSSRLDLEALGDVVSGRVPLVVHASRASDIAALIALAKAERIKVAVVGGEEAWRVADDLAAARIPVILDPFDNIPQAFASRHARADNAALLARAGVKIALATNSSHNAGNLRFYAGNAVRAGLVREVALRATTLSPAEIYGVSRSYGSIDRGKIANLVVWTGDPFEPSSYAETVVIRGEVQPTASRQTQLAERYLERLGLVKDKK